MRCITIKQPWALAIFRGKSVENRNWPTRHRGPLLIHAGLQPDKSGLARVHEIAGRWIVPDDLSHPDYVYGAIIGVVDLAACQFETGLKWGEPGMFHWVLRRARMFTKPIPWMGQQKLFNVPDKAIQGVTYADL